jgi:hypothetical protein
MIRPEIRKALTLIAVVVFMVTNAQAQVSNLSKEKLTGLWGMYFDRHPDGWGKHKPPYEYLQFKEDGKYVRIYLSESGDFINLGSYAVESDGTIRFSQNVGTNGVHYGTFEDQTSKVFSLSGEKLELWEDWKRILWKGTKVLGHKKRFRMVTTEEKQKAEQITSKLLAEYSAIKEKEKLSN